MTRRAEIRAAVVAALDGALAIPVDDQVVREWEDADLPRVQVVTYGEAVNQRDLSGPAWRDLRVDVLGYTTGSPATIQGALDALAVQIEAAVPVQLGAGLVARLQDIGVEIVTDRATVLGRVTVRYGVQYA